MQYSYRPEDKYQNTAPVLGVHCENKDEFDKMVEVMFGVKKMGFDMKWNSNLYDVIIFLLEKNKGIVIEKNEEEKIYFYMWLHDNYHFVPDRINYCYELYKEVESRGV